MKREVIFYIQTLIWYGIVFRKVEQCMGVCVCDQNEAMNISFNNIWDIFRQWFKGTQSLVEYPKIAINSFILFVIIQFLNFALTIGPYSSIFWVGIAELQWHLQRADVVLRIQAGVLCHI